MKINITSVGDPTDPKTWSGTPNNLYNELRRNNWLDTAFKSDVLINKYFQRPLFKFLGAYYHNSVDLQRGFFFRYLFGNNVIERTKRSKSKITLHTGTLNLPFLWLPKNQSHYLYCDSTWDLWSKNSTQMGGYSNKLLVHAEQLDRKAYNQMKHIFSISNYVKENLISNYQVEPEKITVVGTGLGIIKPHFGEKDYSNNKILFVAKGRFEDKGGPLVIDAFKIALKSNPNLELTIIGQRNYVDKINIPNTKVYGFIPVDELQKIFNESSLFVMPAVNEPWGLVYLEALACRIPIVGLNKNSFPEISKKGKYGYSLNYGTSIELANIILEAFDNPNKLNEIGLQAQLYCLQNYTWQNTIGLIMNKINEIEA